MPIIRLVDGALLIQSMNRSMKGVTVPATYTAMCCQCGEIVRHQIDKGEIVHCRSGHKVAPTIARASLMMPRKPAASGQTPKNAPRPHSRREIRAHNAKYEARMMKKPPGA
jgi:hypothetical protein